MMPSHNSLSIFRFAARSFQRARHKERMRQWLMFLLILCSAGWSVAQNSDRIAECQALLIDALREDMTGKREKAIELYEKIRYEKEFAGVANFYLAKSLQALGKTEDALLAASRSVQADPANKWYLLLKCHLSEQLFMPLRAAEGYMELAKLEPGNYTFYDNAAFQFKSAGDFKRALEAMEWARTQFGLTAEIAQKTAALHAASGKYENAVELLEAYLLRHPDDAASVEQLLGYAKATNNAKLLSRVSTQFGASPLAQANDSHHASVEARLRDPSVGLDDKLKPLIHQLESADKSQPAAVRSLLPYAEMLLQQYPSEPKSHCFAADLHYLLNDLPQAKKHYIQAVEVGKVPYLVWDNLLQCLSDLGHWHAAKRFATRCLDYYPTQFLPQFVQVNAAYQLGDTLQGGALLEQLERTFRFRKPRSPELLLLKAKLSKASGSDSEDLWKAALQGDSFGINHLHYAIFLCRKGAFASAQQVLDGPLASTAQRPSNGALLARLYDCLGNGAAAKQALDAHSSSGAFVNAEHHRLAAAICEKLGDEKCSQYHLDRAQLLEEPPQ
jgi:tetratricopeptide (TPR) repeat protein